MVPPYYDPMISKVVAWAPTRPAAIERLRRALADYVVHGISTNLHYLRAVLDHPAFRSGDYDTGFCAKYEKELVPRADPRHEMLAVVAAAISAHTNDRAEAEAFAARSGQSAATSRWVKLGRARVLRGRA